MNYKIILFSLIILYSIIHKYNTLRKREAFFKKFKKGVSNITNQVSRGVTNIAKQAVKQVIKFVCHPSKDWCENKKREINFLESEKNRYRNGMNQLKQQVKDREARRNIITSQIVNIIDKTNRIDMERTKLDQINNELIKDINNIILKEKGRLEKENNMIVLSKDLKDKSITNIYA